MGSKSSGIDLEAAEAHKNMLRRVSDSVTAEENILKNMPSNVSASKLQRYFIDHTGKMPNGRNIVSIGENEKKTPEFILSHTSTFNNELGVDFYQQNPWLGVNYHQMSKEQFKRWVLSVPKLKEFLPFIGTWEKCLMPEELIDRR